MGYTHYFSTKKALPILKFKLVANAVKKVIKHSDINVRFESNMMQTPALVTGDLIRFNGVGEDALETFYLERDTTTDDFCKTNRKPYDDIVVATLLLAKHFLGDRITVGTDGYNGDFDAGIKLVLDATGIDTTPQINNIKS